MVKLHPYFSCCASCGEIKTPLEGRLCTSLTPSFEVDGVLFGADEALAASVRAAMPWLRRVHTVPEETSLESLLGDPAADLDIDLAEYFFAAFAGSDIGRIRHPLDLFTPNGIPLLAARPDAEAAERTPFGAALCDLLDACGLMPARQAGFDADVYALTRENVAGFAQFRRGLSPDMELPAGPEYFSLLARWAYASGAAIPAGPRHALLGHA